MELSNMKHLQSYTGFFELDYRRFARQPQIYQLSIILNPSMEVIFQTPEPE